ncbi:MULTISPECIES: fimbria/pilus periplasmic chaperone [Stenotrophomonas]|uniref:fimbrial biogenesis chaperone n=1 Tax=Stenotrophomonas TaxID=40323 RepID=UPI00081BF005|nr:MULTISPECIES: fimbria/pilus periplasmic chaperone [Stenotrophomonas]
MTIFLSRVLLAGLASVCPLQALAGVVINGTRVIYPAQAREVTVQVDNVGESPSLVQAWVDSGDQSQTAENSDAPFMLTPPISRVEPGRSQALRLVFTGADLPADRESVFWLNVLDVPPSPQAGGDEQNYLQVAFRSRIKLFYRPRGLPGTANEAPLALRWRHEGDVLRVSNSTPYNVTLAEVQVLDGGAQRSVEQQGKMIGPHQDLQLSVSGRVERVRFISINDYGGRAEHTVSVDAGG